MLASPHKFPYINQHFHTETSFIYYRKKSTVFRDTLIFFAVFWYDYDCSNRLDKNGKLL